MQFFQKKSLHFCKHKWKVRKENCNARHDDKMCFLPNWRYHIILKCNIEELLQKLDDFCINYTRVESSYTLFKYQFSGKSFLRNGKLCHKVERAVHFYHQNRGKDRMPSIERKRLLGKKYQEHLSFKRLNRRILEDQSSLIELNQVERLNSSNNW